MKIEPRADVRGMAVMTMEVYTAFVDAGFTPEQAMLLTIEVLGHALRAAE